jgi:hypothetical protein
MPEAVCLVGDESGPLLSQMRDALVDAGYQVLQAESSTALATRVHEPALVSAAAMLLVIGGRWASQCTVPISVAATMRQQSNLAPTCVVLLYERGTLGVLESPELRHCHTLAMLEKPFELEVLSEVARAVVPQSRT